MKIKYLVLSMALGTTLVANASTSEPTSTNGSIYIVAGIAIVAIILSVINALRISKLKRMIEIGFVNQKEDMDLSFRKMKSSLMHNNKNHRRPNPTNTNTPQVVKKKENTPQNEIINEVNTNETTQAKRPTKRRKYPPRKKVNNPSNTEKNEQANS